MRRPSWRLSSQCRSLCDELHLPLAIARPSVIVNDTVNGRCSAFTHLNVLVEVANRIQEFYGIHDGQVVNQEIRFPVDPSARPNVAAVDPVAEALACIVEAPGSAGKTFHLCHPSPQTERRDLRAGHGGVRDQRED